MILKLNSLLLTKRCFHFGCSDNAFVNLVNCEHIWKVRASSFLISDFWIVTACIQEYITEFHSINRKERVKSAYLSGSDGVMLTAIQKSQPASERPTPTAIIPPQPKSATDRF